MNAERFLAGETLEEFVTRAEKYKELWTIGARRASVPADVVERLSALRSPVRLVALNEDWCLDAVGVIPSVARLAEEIELLDFRSFGRDANPDLMDAHVNGTSRSIPVVIAYDENWRETGWWGSRPAPLQAWIASEGVLLPQEEKYRYTRQWYARDHGATSLREIADMILGGTAVSRPTAAIAG